MGRQLFADHAHKFSPHTFTQPRLFACLAPREHQKKSYRGVEALLVDRGDLRAAIGMSGTPDHNTLCRASKRLVPFDLAQGEGRSVNRALDVQVEQAKAKGLDVAGDEAKPAAMDSTCLGSHHVSRHFERRCAETAAKAAKAAAAVAAVAVQPVAAQKAGKPAKTAKKTAADLKRSKTIRGKPKRSIAVACSCHLILAARATVGMGSAPPAP